MCDSTVLFESPKREGMSTYGPAQLLAETVGVSPDDACLSTWSRFKGRTGPSERELVQFVPQPETK